MESAILIGERSQPPYVCYSTFTEFQKRINKLKLGLFMILIHWSPLLVRYLITLLSKSETSHGESENYDMFTTTNPNIQQFFIQKL